MNGDSHEEMDAAWRRYLLDREKTRYGLVSWNPRLVFEAGWRARASGWSGPEVDDERG